jgi:hypothetical protein
MSGVQASDGTCRTDIFDYRYSHARPISCHVYLWRYEKRVAPINYSSIKMSRCDGGLVFCVVQYVPGFEFMHGRLAFPTVAHVRVAAYLYLL